MVARWFSSSVIRCIAARTRAESGALATFESAHGGAKTLAVVERGEPVVGLDLLEPRRDLGDLGVRQRAQRVRVRARGVAVAVLRDVGDVEQRLAEEGARNVRNGSKSHPASRLRLWMCLFGDTAELHVGELPDQQHRANRRPSVEQTGHQLQQRREVEHFDGNTGWTRKPGAGPAWLPPGRGEQSLSNKG